jgi:hypothetical protein
VSLLCVLGLVPLGMLAYRQMRLPPATQRVVPQGTVVPALDGSVLGAVQAVPEWWARTARAVAPLPRRGEAPAASGQPAAASELAWRGIAERGASLAWDGLRAAGELVGQRLAAALAAEECGPDGDDGPPTPTAQACDAPGAVRGR